MNNGTIEIRRAWVIAQERKGNVFLDLYETKEKAIQAARSLARIDRQNISGIYECWAGELGEHLCELWSYDSDGIDSFSGILGGDSVSAKELADIIQNGRGMS